MAIRSLLVLLVVACGGLATPPTNAQQVTVATPHPVTSHSFYEYFGTSWGIRGNGWFFQFGGPAQPPFGGFDPSAGATFGFAGPNGFLNITAGQGSSTTFSGQSPMVTVMNGGTGAFFDQTLQPLVTGIVPVVGGQPPAFRSVLDERLSRLNAGEGASAVTNEPKSSAALGAGGAGNSPSSAERRELSVAEIKARKAAAASSAEAAVAAEIESLLEQARNSLSAGKPGVAKIYLQMAARRAVGEQQAAIHKQIDELSAAAK